MADGTITPEVKDALVFFYRHYHGTKSPIHATMQALDAEYNKHVATMERLGLLEKTADE